MHLNVSKRGWLWLSHRYGKVGIGSKDGQVCLMVVFGRQPAKPAEGDPCV